MAKELDVKFPFGYDPAEFTETLRHVAEGTFDVGPMITGSQGWHEESIEFEIPADSRAAVVRLRRRASMRFDSKIRGTVWLDNFRLEKIETDRKS